MAESPPNTDVQQGDVSDDVMAQMFEQLQKQQEMMAASLMPQQSKRRNKIVINGMNLGGANVMPNFPIYQSLGSSFDGEADNGDCSTCCSTARTDVDNELINSCDCDECDIIDHVLNPTPPPAAEWYCNGDSWDVSGSETDEEVIGCFENGSSCSSSHSTIAGAALLGEEVEIESDNDNCHCDDNCTTVITMKTQNANGEEIADTQDTAMQTAPTSESVGVQVTGKHTVMTETDPILSGAVMDPRVNDYLQSQGMPMRSRTFDNLNPMQQPQFQMPQNQMLPKAQTFADFGQQQQQQQEQEQEQAQAEWGELNFKDDAVIEGNMPKMLIKECPPTPKQEKEKTPTPREPIYLKFDLGIRIDSIRDLPHLLAAPHGNTEHYCAYCQPETEPLCRPPVLVKARITVYNRVNGNLVQCNEGIVNSETNWAFTNVRYNRYVFGRQSAVFCKSVLSQDSIVLVRIYAHPKEDLYEIDPVYKLIIKQKQAVGTESATGSDDGLIGWSVAYIFDAEDDGEGGECWRLKTGRQLLPIYCPPVPMIIQIPPKHSFKEAGDPWKKYRRLGVHSSVALWLGRGAFNNLDDSSEESDIEADPEVRNIDKKLWVSGGGQPRPTEAFTAIDGFDLYVDGARCLPDFVTISKVTVRIGQANHKKAASDEICYSQLESDIFNPVYDYRIEHRKLPSEITPRATLIFKLYTICRFTQRLTVVGYSYLNLFNNLGVIGQPVVDEGVQVSLNEGGFQLRIYANAPNLEKPLSVQMPVADRHRSWPCASLLVRIVKAPKDDFGTVLSVDDVPQSKWIETGLVKLRPTNYCSAGYFSKTCRPSYGERQAFATYRRRLPCRVKKAVIELGKQMADRTIPDDNEDLLKGVLERLLSRFGVDNENGIPHGNLNYAVAYDPVYGFAISVDSAIGLPWSGTTFGHLVVNPPSAHYLVCHIFIFFVKSFKLNSTKTHRDLLIVDLIFPNLSLVLTFVRLQVNPDG